MTKSIVRNVSFAALLCAAQSALCAGVETPVVRGAEKAVAVAIDVAGAEEVKLVATVGPDTYDFDQAIWCEPAFVMKDGSRVDATTLQMRSHKAGWGKVEFNRVSWGGAKAAKVGGETFNRFISAATVPLSIRASVKRFCTRLSVRLTSDWI